MKPITPTLLVLCGASPVHAAEYAAAINKYADQYKVNTFLRLAHFLSQILHESQLLTATSENLNYSEAALIKTWPTRFMKALPGQRIKEGEKRQAAYHYARQPAKIANYVYANRLGNGPPESGDGWKYRGRGPIQSTGKDKYIIQSKRTGVDYVTHPELLERPDDGTRAAFDYWKDNGLNQIADTDNPAKVTNGVNGGLNGYAHRLMLLEQCKLALTGHFL